MKLGLIGSATYRGKASSVPAEVASVLPAADRAQVYLSTLNVFPRDPLELKLLEVGYIDADDDASAAFREKYEITGIPVTLIFRNGNPEPIKFSELTSVAAIRDGIAGIAPEPKPKK